MTLGERIKFIRGTQAREMFAPIMEVSKNTLISYEKDERVPGADFLNRILELYPDISPAWLLTGEGEMRRGDTPITGDPGVQYSSNKKITPQLDEELLQSVLEAVEEYLDSIDGHLPAAKKAQLVVMLYEMVEEGGEKKVNKTAVIRLVRLAA